MILNNQIINKIKAKSGLSFDKAKDYDFLCEKIFITTGRTIGVNTVKRLMGYIIDDRKTNEYTLNTIAIYLGLNSWEELCCSLHIDSDWNYEEGAYYINELNEGTKITVRYLNREVTFKVEKYNNIKALKVIDIKNSSLHLDDILIVHKLKVGAIIEAEQVFRGTSIGNYKTNGEVTSIIIE